MNTTFATPEFRMFKAVFDYYYITHNIVSDKPKLVWIYSCFVSIYTAAFCLI